MNLKNVFIIALIAIIIIIAVVYFITYENMKTNDTYQAQIKNMAHNLLDNIL